MSYFRHMTPIYTQQQNLSTGGHFVFQPENFSDVIQPFMEHIRGFPDLICEEANSNFDRTMASN